MQVDCIHMSYLLASGVDIPRLLTCILPLWPYETLKQVAKHSLSLSHMLNSNFIGSLGEGPCYLYELSICLSEGSRRGSLGRGWRVQEGSLSNLSYHIWDGAKMGFWRELGGPGGGLSGRSQGGGLQRGWVVCPSEIWEGSRGLSEGVWEWWSRRGLGSV